MVEAIYEKLIPVLNSLSTMLISVKCDEYFTLISYLFTPEEAAIAVAMPKGFITVEEIAWNLPGKDTKQLELELDAMADRGLIQTQEKDGVIRYELLPLIPGSVDIQLYGIGTEDRIRKVDDMLIAYMKALHKMSKSGEIAPAEASVGGRRVEVGQDVFSQLTVIPYEEAREIVEKAEYVAVSVCHCRLGGAWHGNPCSKPMNNCLIVGNSAGFTAQRGFTRLITKDEAIEILDEAEREDLVHQYGNTPEHFYNVLCSCCQCHCPLMKGWKRAPVPNQMVIARYLIQVDNDACTACGECVQRCPMEALSMQEGQLVRDAKRCVGCGLCRYVCPANALRLGPTAAGKIPLK